MHSYHCRILVFPLLLLLATAGLTQASIVSSHEVAATTEGKPGVAVRYVAGRPISVLYHIGGAGDLVVYCDGDSDEILAMVLGKRSGELTAASWRQLADHFLQRCQEQLRAEKKRAKLDYTFREIMETLGTGDAAVEVKRTHLHVTGRIIRPPAAKGKQRSSFFNRKEDQ